MRMDIRRKKTRRGNKILKTKSRPSFAWAAFTKSIGKDILSLYMQNQAEQLAAIEQIHQEYLIELAKLTVEEQTAVRAFLESVRQKKIAEITAQMNNLEA